MNDATTLKAAKQARRAAGAAARKKPVVTLKEHIVEIISDSGEGAQRCGQSLGSIAAQDGQRHLDGGDHPGRDPPAGAQRRRRQRQPHPHRRGPHHQRRRRDRPGGRLQRAGAARARARPRTQARLHHPAREHVAHQHGPRRSPRPTSRRTTSWSRPATRCIEMPMERECRALVNDARRGKNMFALGMLCSIYSLDLELAREQIALTFGKKEQSVIDANVKLLDAGHAWAEANLDFKYRIPATRSTEPQIVVNGNTALALGRARLGDGNLRDVSDHARHLGFALPDRRVREGRRHRAPGGGRDRRLRLRHRRVVRRQVRGDDHLRPGLLAEAGGHRPRGDGRDPAGRGQRAARRPQHRAADQGRAGRPADRDLRQPRRRAQGGDGARAPSRTASTRSSPRARSPRPSTWWWWC